MSGVTVIFDGDGIWISRSHGRSGGTCDCKATEVVSNGFCRVEESGFGELTAQRAGRRIGRVIVFAVAGCVTAAVTSHSLALEIVGRAVVAGIHWPFHHHHQVARCVAVWSGKIYQDVILATGEIQVAIKNQI